MKGLGQFRRFDWQSFAEGKTFQVVAVADWVDRDTGKRVGRRIDVVITEDNTAYEFKKGEQFSNIYERLTFKVNGATDAAIGTTVIPIGVTARCYGDYQTQLSVTCNSLKTIQPQAGQKVKE